MTSLGKGLESLIPPQQSRQPSDQPQNDLGKTPLESADTPRTEHLPAEALAKEGLAVPLGLVSDLVSEPAEREEEVRPLEPDNPSSDRGVSADDQRAKGIVFQIEIDKIKPNPHQPRRDFDEGGLKELSQSIREFGVIQPLVVSKIEKESDRGWEVEYELVTGERRLLAAKMAGLRTVPAIIRRIPKEREKLELAVIENIQRSDLNPIELARAIARLQDEFKLTQREIAARLGKSREAIANSIRLLGLPSEIQEAVASGKINESQARLLLSIDDVAAKDRLFQEILKSNLTVREISLKVRQLKGETVKEARGDAPPRVGGSKTDPEFLAIREQLEELLGAPVELKSEGEGGKLTINFYSREELKTILEKFTRTPNED